MELPKNFDAPYKAASLQEFWRRWHITLSEWLRDYLYIALGGSRGSRARTALNLLLTMLLGGLWHGANVTFVIWGGLHGLGLGAERALKRLTTGRKAPRVLRALVTFHVVVALWVFFRADTLSGALDVFAQIGRLTPGWSNLTAPIAALLVAGFVTHLVPDDTDERLARAFIRAPSFFQAAVALGVLYLAREASASGAAPFIYFQF